MQRERPEEKCLESSWATFNSIFMNNKGPSQTLKGVHFSSLLLLKSSLYKPPEIWFFIVDTHLLL